jgi:hypothetical protein
VGAATVWATAFCAVKLGQMTEVLGGGIDDKLVDCDIKLDNILKGGGGGARFYSGTRDENVVQPCMYASGSVRVRLLRVLWFCCRRLRASARRTSAYILCATQSAELQEAPSSKPQGTLTYSYLYLHVRTRYSRRCFWRPSCVLRCVLHLVLCDV